MATSKGFACVLLACAVFVATVNAEALQCQGVDMNATEQQMLHLKDCAQSVGANDKSDLTIENLPCFAKCVFEHKHLVDEEGKPHKENIVNVITDSMPEQVKEAVTTELGKCFDDYGKAVANPSPITKDIKPSDETCVSYTALAICIHTKYQSICHDAPSR